MSFKEAENNFFPEDIYGDPVDEILDRQQGTAASEPDSKPGTSCVDNFWDTDSFQVDVRKTISELLTTEEPRTVTLNDGTIVQL
jgi:hypothetical protein